MDPFATSHYSNRALLLELKASVECERNATAVVLSRIAEVEERRLFLQEGYPSKYEFCVRELKYAEGAAYKRLTAARVARQFPAVLVAVAEGRLHLSGVVMLSKYLKFGNPDALLAAAMDKTKAEIELLIASRFPRPDLPERLEALSPPPTVPAQGNQLSPGTVAAAFRRATPMPLAPKKFGFQFTGDQETHELYEDVRALLSKEVPSGEMALVFKETLKIARAQLMKSKFAATHRPAPARGSADPRHIPAAVKRAVSERDQGRCSFVSKSGTRCGSRRMLEYDHIEPLARGGMSSVENVRLLCHAHNQHEANRTYGVEFMEHKRREA